MSPAPARLRPEQTVRIAPTPADLLPAIHYAGRSLHFTYKRMPNEKDSDRLLNIMVGKLAERAFAAFLAAAGIPHRSTGPKHWSETDRADLIVRERKVDLKAFHTFPTDWTRDTGHTPRRFPDWLFQRSDDRTSREALVPRDQLEKPEPAEVYVQAFVVAPGRNGAKLKLFVTPFPERWAQARARGHEGTRVEVELVAPHAERPVQLTLYGEQWRGGAPEDASETILLGPQRAHARSETEFCSLQYATVNEPPAGAVRVHGRKTHTIAPEGWCDLWRDVHGVYLTGWAPRGAFLPPRGTLYPPGSAAGIYPRATQTPNYGVPMHSLHPLPDLATADLTTP